MTYILFVFLTFISIYLYDQFKKLQIKVSSLEESLAKLLSNKNTQVTSSVAKNAKIETSSATTTKLETISPKITSLTKTSNFEKNFTEKIMVWIGSIAIILAGFYMVKFSIENSLFTPKLRLFSASIFSFALFAQYTT